jgi:hypothetical protein
MIFPTTRAITRTRHVAIHSGRLRAWAISMEIGAPISIEIAAEKTIR